MWERGRLDVGRRHPIDVVSLSPRRSDQSSHPLSAQARTRGGIDEIRLATASLAGDIMCN
jgi:hypothetical protein